MARSDAFTRSRFRQGRGPRPRLRSRFRLGLVPGLAIVLLALAGCDDATPVLFDSPTQIQAHPAQGGSQVGDGVVGEVVEAPPGVVLLDAAGNRAPGARVTFRVVTGEGQVDAGEVRADAEGVARPRGWVLGPGMGRQAVEAHVSGVGQVRLEVEARAGPASELAVASTSISSGPAGVLLAEPATLRVTDRFGNPVRGHRVTFEVTEGGGSVAPPALVTDDTGRVRIESWTLGPNPGPNRLVARSEGTSPVVLEITGTDAPSLQVVAVHLNQGNRELGGAPAVAHRGGLLRVFPVGGQPGDDPTRVRLTLFHDGAPVRSEEVALAQPPHPAQPLVGNLGASWNLELEAHEVRVGLGLKVELLMEDGSEFYLLPNEGGVEPVAVEEIAPLRLVLFPIRTTEQGLTGNITTANLDAFLADTRRWIPAAEVEAEIRPPFITDGDMSTHDGWIDALSALQASRVAEGATDAYYHGLVPDFSGILYGGLAYLPASPESPFRSGLTYDRLPVASGILAHELGHNLGRRHAPCGGPDGVDPNFPHANAGIGGPGFDVLSREVRFPTGHHDYMSYCGPRWTSDYTWEGILEWRRNDPKAAPAAMSFALAAGVAGSPPDTPGSGLLLWGRLTPDGAVLSPALALERGVPATPSSGPHRIRGLDAEGTVLFEHRVEGVEVDHAPGEEHFSAFLPLAPTLRERIHRIVLDGPGGEASWTAGGEPAIVLLREPDTGEVRGILHPRSLGLDAPDLEGLPPGQELRLHLQPAPPGAPGRDAAPPPIGTPLPPGLELVVSDGVQSRVVRPPEGG